MLSRFSTANISFLNTVEACIKKLMFFLGSLERLLNNWLVFLIPACKVLNKVLIFQSFSNWGAPPQGARCVYRIL